MSNEQSPLERVTVNLTPRASAALADAAELTGYNRTDVINRAVQVYAHLEKVQRDGGRCLVQSASGEPPEVLRFL